MTTNRTNSEHSNNHRPGWHWVGLLLLPVALAGATGISHAFAAPQGNGSAATTMGAAKPLSVTEAAFADSGIVLTPVDSGDAAWGDYDNDGKLDFMLIGNNWHEFSTPASYLYHNTGSGFEDKSSIVPGLPQVKVGSVDWGDYDNDGKLDFLITGLARPTIDHAPISKLYHNTGNGFEDRSSIVPGLPQISNSTVAWADYDNDGKLDFLITGDNQGTAVSILYHNTGAAFEDKSSIVPGMTGLSGYSASWADYDNDGKVDFLLSGRFNGARVTRLYHNTGAGFEDQTATAPGIATITTESSTWGDYDGDSKLDFLITGYGSSGPVGKLYHNTGSGFEDKTAIVPAMPQPTDGDVAWRDYDNDGKLDFLITGHSGSYPNDSLVTRLYHNTGVGFEDKSAIVAGLVQVEDSDVSWSDYDGDGKVDFLVSGFDGTRLVTKLYHSTGSLPLATATPTTPVATATPCPFFCDVNTSDYFYTPVQELVRRGAISGYSDNTFRPFNNATRGQLAKIVVVAQGWTLSNPSRASFSDVAVDSAFFAYVETAVQHSIISGYSDGSFKPNNNVTRGQLSKIIVLAQGWTLANPATATFTDVAPGSTFYQFVEIAVKHGIISGYDIPGGKEFRPGANATRGQIAKIVYLAVGSTK